MLISRLPLNSTKRARLFELIIKINYKDANKESSTVNDLIDEYLEIWAKPRKRSWKEDERFLDKNVKPYWGKPFKILHCFYMDVFNFKNNFITN
jgi:hypothetical protein